MKELTDEQYHDVVIALNNAGFIVRRISDSGLPSALAIIKAGRAAYAASFPHAVAEALEEFTDAEWSYISSVAKPLKPRDKDYPRNRADVALSRRVTALTAKPDAAVEAVKALTINWMNMKLTDGSAREVVAAVDAARAKEAK